MDLMFSGCYSLESLYLTNFNISNAHHIGGMFENCHSINSLNLNNFDTSKILNMDNMFANCYSLNDLNINNFDTSQVTIMSNMFANCSNLVYINLKKAKIKTNSNTQKYLGLPMIILLYAVKVRNGENYYQIIIKL